MHSIMCYVYMCIYILLAIQITIWEREREDVVK